MGRKKKPQGASRAGPTPAPGSPAAPLSSDELKARARALLDRREAREAAYLLRQAKRAAGEAGAGRDGDLLLLLCYSLRARELAARGLDTEAAAARELAQPLRPLLEQPIADADLPRAVRFLDLDDALVLAARPGSGGESEGGALALRALADRIVAAGAWVRLAALPELHPLRADAALLERAAPLMLEGRWSEAAQALAPIGRRSPYSAWRAFCRAMAAWAENDDAALVRALDVLPDDFLLFDLSEALRAAAKHTPETACDDAATDAATDAAGAASERSAKRARLQAILGGAGLLSNQSAELRRAVERGRARELAAVLPGFARALSGAAPEDALDALVDILALAARRGQLAPDTVVGLARELLPGPRGQIGAARAAFLSETFGHDDYDVEPARRYLDLATREMRDPSQARLARSLMLDHLARAVADAGVCSQCVGEAALAASERLAGGAARETGFIEGDLMLASLELDPGNRDGYRFLLARLRGSERESRLVDEILERMAREIPDDAQPLLELALRRASSGAHRRAEAAVEEAARRAPQDEKVREGQALVYLRLADAARSRRKERKAIEREFARAEALGIRKLEPVLWAKRTTLDLLDGLDLGERLSRFHSQPGGLGLRHLGLLWLDVSGLKPAPPGLRQRLDGAIAAIGDRIDQLSADEALALLQPVAPELELLFPARAVAPAFRLFWGRLLRAAGGERFFRISDLVIGSGGGPLVHLEVDGRLGRGAATECAAELRFYQAFLENRQGAWAGAERFWQILEGAQSEDRERVRQAAGRLASLAHGDLAALLRELERPPMQSSPGAGGDRGGKPRNREDDGDREWPGSAAAGRGGFAPDPLEAGGFEAGVEGVLPDLFAPLESLIDENNMRGQPDGALRAWANELRQDPQARDLFEVLSMAAALSVTSPSREAGVLLEGVLRRRRRR